MSTPFVNFLSGAQPGRTYKSYAHATGLFTVGNRMPRLPKLGFIYFVQFQLNDFLNTKVTDQWKNDIGFLAKKVDLPKFKVATTTLNQYNRKANIQTKLTYEPINIEFHDDNSEVTSLLWRMYSQYYYADGRTDDGKFTEAFLGDTKYKKEFQYGYAPTSGQQPFFKSIDIFVLHQGNFSQYSISNPIVTQWDHDSLDQSNGQKLLQNKIGFAYDSVAYYQGTIKSNTAASSAFSAVWYDKDRNIKNESYAPPHEVKAPSVMPNYPTPAPPGLSTSQLGNGGAIPVVRPPRPIGAGTFGLSSYRPPSFGLGGIDVWYGYGGLHTRAVVNAGPIRLVLKR